MNQLFMTIWDGGNLLLFLKFPNPSSQEPWEMYLIRLYSNAEQISPPTPSLAHIMQFHPLRPASEGFKRNFPFMCFTAEPKDLGRIQLPVENCGAWIYHWVLKDSLKETQDKVTVLTLSCTKAEGKWSSWKEWRGISTKPPHSNTPHSLLLSHG